MKHLTLIRAAVVLGMLTAGCETAPAKAPSPHERVAAAINRDAAIRVARQDAAMRFGDGWIAWIDAAALGRYWVVDLRAENGKGLRYGILLSDGSIRLRTVFQ